jgi:hypothetical protein
MNVGRKISLANTFLVLLTAVVAAIDLYRVDDIQANALAIADQSPGVRPVCKLAQFIAGPRATSCCIYGFPRNGRRWS